MKWIYDIEIYPNYFCVTFLNLENEKTIVFEIDENTLKQDKVYLGIRRFMKNIWVIGYNNLTFDNIIMNYIIKDSPLVEDIFSFSQKLIQNDFIDLYSEIKQYKYNNNYASIDLMRLLFSKALRVGLKELEVTMNYHNVQELPYPFDTTLSKEQKVKVLEYNLNDCKATKKLCEICLPAIELRKVIKDEFGLDCFSKDGVRTGVDLLFKLYCEKTKDDPSFVKNLRSYRPSIKLKDIISDKVSFKSKEFSELLNTLEKAEIKGTKGVLDYKILYGNVLHVYGTGGIHSKDKAGIIEPKEDEVYIDADVASLYPSILILYNFKPEHLKSEFLEIYSNLRQQRLDAKRAGKMLISDTYKLSLNGTYGNLINSYSWLYDPKAAMGITLNGQLFLSMLSERLIDTGIKVDSLNTDGITCLIPKTKVDLYYQICKEWEQLTGLELEFNEYKKVIRRDVNTYFAIFSNGKVKEKGDFLTKPVLGKGYDKPIISIALLEYFRNGVPVETTIKTPNYKYIAYENGKEVERTTSIYDFCMMKKIDKKYKCYWNGELQQRINRYYVSTNGAYLYKQKPEGNLENLLKGFGVTLFNQFVEKEDYNIDYNYYISEAKKIINEIEPNQLSLF